MAVEDCILFLAIMSPDFDKCKWCYDEATFAHYLDKPMFGLKIRGYTTLKFSGLHLSNTLQYYVVTNDGKHRLMLGQLVSDMNDMIQERKARRREIPFSLNWSSDEDEDGNGNKPRSRSVKPAKRQRDISSKNRNAKKQKGNQGGGKSAPAGTSQTLSSCQLNVAERSSLYKTQSSCVRDASDATTDDGAYRLSAEDAATEPPELNRDGYATTTTKMENSEADGEEDTDPVLSDSIQLPPDVDHAADNHVTIKCTSPERCDSEVVDPLNERKPASNENVVSAGRAPSWSVSDATANEQSQRLDVLERQMKQQERWMQRDRLSLMKLNNDLKQRLSEVTMGRNAKLDKVQFTSKKIGEGRGRKPNIDFIEIEKRVDCMIEMTDKLIVEMEEQLRQTTLAPGGSVVQDAGTERTSVYENSIFKTKDDTTSLKAQYERVMANAERKKGIQSKLEDMMIHNDKSVKEMIFMVKDHMAKTNMQEHEMVVVIWNTLMNAIEWNKKEELVADQALKHLKQYTSLLAALTENGRSELALLTKMQEYCYDNMNFLKVFQKIVVLFYKADVLGEDSILKWYQDSHLPKGKSVFLEQMKGFIQWLQNAEEESEEED